MEVYGKHNKTPEEYELKRKEMQYIKACYAERDACLGSKEDCYDELRTCLANWQDYDA